MVVLVTREISVCARCGKTVAGCKCIGRGGESGPFRAPYQRDVSSKYGAPMGRRSVTLTGRVHLHRVRLDSGGYDQGGAYWGIGDPLYCAWNDEGENYIRASDRGQAKIKLRGCTFYR
jgi:hypothetical protein